MSEWQTVDRPGYFGRHRDERYLAYDAEYGAANWRLAWVAGDATGGVELAVMLYEDAYLDFLQHNPLVVEELVSEASDVYDDAPSNVASGLDYRAQETSRTHLQDIAIRRCLVRLGRRFEGSQLIRIRDRDGEHPLSLTLSPGRVPFHRHDLIIRPELEGWWQRGSVEAFYQSNKLLQVRA